MSNILSAIERALDEIPAPASTPPPPPRSLCEELLGRALSDPPTFRTSASPRVLPDRFASQVPDDLRQELGDLWRLNLIPIRQCEGRLHHITGVAAEKARQFREFHLNPLEAAYPEPDRERSVRFLQMRLAIMGKFSRDYGARYFAAYGEAYQFLVGIVERELDVVHVQERAVASDYGVTYRPGVVVMSLLRAHQDISVAQGSLRNEEAQWRTWMACGLDVPDRAVQLHPRTRLLELLRVPHPDGTSVPETETESAISPAREPSRRKPNLRTS